MLYEHLGQRDYIRSYHRNLEGYLKGLAIGPQTESPSISLVKTHLVKKPIGQLWIILARHRLRRLGETKVDSVDDLLTVTTG